jgi:hypothetical protein
MKFKTLLAYFLKQVISLFAAMIMYSVINTGSLVRLCCLLTVMYCGGLAAVVLPSWYIAVGKRES